MIDINIQNEVTEIEG